MVAQKQTGFRSYTDPLEVVDRTDIDYADRLSLLQDWLAELAGDEAPEDARSAVEEAIRALEMGSVVQNDQPEEATQAGYRPDDAPT